MKKKIIALLLALLLLAGASALAESEPIVNTWYMFYSKAVTPEFEGVFQGYDYIMACYIFMDDGTILNAENDIAGKTATPINGPAGKWEKSGDGYTYNIIGLGQGRALVEGDRLLLELQQPANTYLALHRMIPFSPYTDYEFRR